VLTSSSSRIQNAGAPPGQPQPQQAAAVMSDTMELAEVPVYNTAMPPKVARRMKGWSLDRIPELLQWTGAEEEEETHDHSIVIAQDVTIAEFVKALGDAEKLPCKFALKNGDVLVYELPSEPHSAAIMSIGGMMGAFNYNTANDTLVPFTAPRLTFGPNNVLEPDGAWKPRGLGSPPSAVDAAGVIYPTLVFEVGYTESTVSLHNLAPIYLGPNTSIQLYVAIKIFGRRGNGTFAMLALLYSRTNAPVTTPVHAISCGTAPIVQHVLTAILQPPLLTGVGIAAAPACNQAGLPQYQLHLPLASIYHGVGVPAGLPLNFDLDLFQLQRNIFA